MENQPQVSRDVVVADVVGRASDVLSLGALQTTEPQPTPETPQPAVPPVQPTTPAQQESIVDPQDLQQIVSDIESVDVAALRAGLDNIVDPTTQQTPQTPQYDPTTKEGFNEFATNFQEYTGVDLKKALTNYNSLVDNAQQTQQAMLTMQRQQVVQQQRLELANVWANDPVVQQQVQQGAQLLNIVDQRVQQLSRVYKTLSESDKNKVNAAGVRGIGQLWNSVQKNRQNQQMPTGNVTNQQVNTNGGNYTYSQIMAMSDVDFNRIGRQLLDNGQFVDDRKTSSTRKSF